MFKASNLTEIIGSEVSLDPREAGNPSIGAALRELLRQRGVLVFRQINLTDEQQVALANSMGKLRNEGERGIYKITLDKSLNVAGDYLKGSFLWHMDGTHDSIPVFASLLSGRQLSSVGGQTEFANTYAAYEALPPDMKKRLDGLKVTHSVRTSMHRAGIEETPENVAFWSKSADRTHSLVWTHADGRKSLVIGCHASHVEGMNKRESDDLLDYLLDWATQPRFVYRHEWSVGDLLIWDNTGVLHRAEPYPLDSGRLMHRTTLLGEEAFS